MSDRILTVEPDHTADMTDAPINAPRVDLTECDREPIHIPGQCQPHGVVIVLDPASAEMSILQATENIADLCGADFTNLLGQPSSSLFSVGQCAILERARCSASLQSNRLYLFTGNVNDRGPFHVSAHIFKGLLTVELELADEKLVQSRGTEIQDSPLFLLRQALIKLRTAETLGEYCNSTCQAIQQMTGFDRVMVYRFHADGHGEVIAEVISNADDRGAFLGLHFPESDIPRQARALFVVSNTRLLPDALYEPSCIVPSENPLTGLPLDMTHCLLRGYSKKYTEYLINMGARASMSLAIVRGDALWGLITCQHVTPHKVPFAVRSSCASLLDVVSLQIADKRGYEEAQSRERILNVHQSLVDRMALLGSMRAGLTRSSDSDNVTALELVEADGCAVVSDEGCVLLGLTPSEEEVLALIAWLSETRSPTEDVWSTDEFNGYGEDTESAGQKYPGLLSLSIGDPGNLGYWVVWFRREVAQTMNWGGNPNKPFDDAKNGDSYTPRKSFEKWQETIRGRSFPWRETEIEAARRLQTAILHVIVNRAQELARLNLDLSRSNIELDSFAYAISHDLKEPLRGINNYIQFLREDQGALFNTEAEEKLDKVLRLTKRMDNLLDSLLHYSRLGGQTLSLKTIDLNILLDDVYETLKPIFDRSGVEFRKPRPMPNAVLCDAVQVGELYINLITNALKYNDRPPGERWVEIGWYESDPKRKQHKPAKKAVAPGPTVFWVRDNGIGILEKHYPIIFRVFKRLHALSLYGGGAGAGLTICQRIVERHKGAIWLDSVIGVGTTFFFTLPITTQLTEMKIS